MVSQYADDTSCFVNGFNSIQKLFQKLQLFKNCSGLELNKTEAMWLGKNRPQPAYLFGINRPLKCVCLGICFSHDLATSTKDNFEKKLLSLKKCLNIWSSRDLTLYGKINIIESLALSKMIFVSSVLSVPNRFIDQVNKLLSNFIWNHKPPKIKRPTMVGKIEQGGLNMPGFEIINKSLKAGWAKRFLTPVAQSWETIPLSFLQPVGGSLLFKCIFSLKALPDLPLLPQFYKDVSGAWEEIVIHTPKTRKKNKRWDLVEQSPYYNWRKICLL